MPEPHQTQVPEGLRYKPPRGLKLVGLTAAVLAVAVVAAGVIGRNHADAALKGWTAGEAIPTVSVVLPATGTGDQELVLPGQVQAYYQAPIYARVSGYVRQWFKDIGAPVRRGEALAVIDTPELDQQIAQARADLAQAQAAQTLSQTTATRWRNLLAQDAVSKQETDEKVGDLAAKTALVKAAQANVDRLTAMRSFSRLVAPFDGVVTARKTDIGRLVNAGAGASAGSELFDVSDEHRLRVYVHVPQNYAAQVRRGMMATLTVPEHPGQTFPAVLATTSQSVGEQSGALTVELQTDNAGRQLTPGDYAQVRFDLPGNASTMRLSSNTLMFRKGGLSVAVVGPDSRIIMRRITVGRDFGAQVEVLSGLQAGDRVVENPPDSLTQGDLVRISGAARERTAAQAGGASAQG